MKAAWSAFSMSKDKKARIGSRDVDIMGLCDRARNLPPCIVQIEETCENNLCKNG